MNSTALSNKGVKLAVSALLAACAFMALGLAFSNNAKAASTAGAPFEVTFNHAGLNVDVTLAQLDEKVLDSDDPTPLVVSGTYDDTAGNFTLPQETGLVFPPIALPLDDEVNLSGSIELASDGHGNYNDATGVMTMDIGIALEIGVSDVSALPIPGLGTGALTCRFSPINVKLSTANGWPHAGSAFADKAAIENGALAGAFRSKPAVTTVDGNPSACGLIANVLKPVGGLWLAHSDTLIETMPAPTSPKPTAETCAEHGQEGTFPNCSDPEPVPCPEGFTGNEPDCVPIVTDGKITSVTAPKKATVKAGKTVKIKVTVKNTGGKSVTGKIALKSSNKAVTLPKTVSVTVAAGKTATKTITVKATKKAKGKATITASISGKSAKTTITVKK